MYKLFFLLIPFLLPVKPDHQFIDWNAERKLVWDDFKGKPDPVSTNVALTNSNIHLEYGYNQKGFTYAIKCRFNKNLSWVRLKNDYILNHEQGHFDLSEVYARLLHKELSAYRFNGKTVDKDVQGIHGRVIGEFTGTQQQYDKETRHSLDTLQQRQWDNKIRSLLQQYAEYANYRQPAGGNR